MAGDDSSFLGTGQWLPDKAEPASVVDDQRTSTKLSRR